MPRSLRRSTPTASLWGELGAQRVPAGSPSTRSSCVSDSAPGSSELGSPQLNPRQPPPIEFESRCGGTAVGHQVPPAAPMMRLSGCRHPRGFGLVIRESRGGLQSVLGCIQNQVPFVVFLTRVEGAEGNRNILLAHAEES